MKRGESMQFSEFDLNILGEIGNVSVGGAATSLSEFVNRLVTISIPQTRLLTFKELMDQFSPSVVYAKIDYMNGLTGSNMIFMHREEALALAKIVAEEKTGIVIERWDTFSFSVIEEVISIMVGNMSASMSEIFNKPVDISVPVVREGDIDQLNLADEDEMLISIWFDLKVEDFFKMKVVKIIKPSEALEMVSLIKGEFNL
jgi:flagellar motor switch protein FliN/FliY